MCKYRAMLGSKTRSRTCHVRLLLLDLDPDFRLLGVIALRSVARLRAVRRRLLGRFHNVEVAFGTPGFPQLLQLSANAANDRRMTTTPISAFE